MDKFRTCQLQQVVPSSPFPCVRLPPYLPGTRRRLRLAGNNSNQSFKGTHPRLLYCLPALHAVGFELATNGCQLMSGDVVNYTTTSGIALLPSHMSLPTLRRSSPAILLGTPFHHTRFLHTRPEYTQTRIMIDPWADTPRI